MNKNQLKNSLVHLKAVGSTEGWAVYPNLGYKCELRYEEFQDKMNKRMDVDAGDFGRLPNRVLIVSAEYGVGAVCILISSKWRWEFPFENEVIDRQKQDLIIKRLRSAYEYLGYRVVSESLEESAGIKVASINYKVRVGSDGLIYYEDNEIALAIPCAKYGSDVSVKLVDLCKSNSSSGSAANQDHIVQKIIERIAIDLDKHGQSLVVIK